MYVSMPCDIASNEHILSAWSSDGEKGMNVGVGVSVCVLVLAVICGKGVTWLEACKCRVGVEYRFVSCMRRTAGIS